MILCCGEALIDMLPRDLPDGSTGYVPHAGGAVFNTSIALGRLGAKSGFLCGLSKDLFGDILIEELTKSGVNTELSPRMDRPCTLAFVKLVDGQATYAFYDENTALKALTVEDLPSLPKDVHALFFGGISLVSEPCGTAYETLMKTASADRVTMVDPNVREGFITDRATTSERYRRMMGMADIVKLSDEDLHWIMGPGEIAAQAEEIRNSGARIVLITEGAKGVTAYNNSGAIFVEAEKVEVVDTVGAGDTFSAGFLSSLSASGRLTKQGINSLTPEVLRSALARGVRTAAITVSRAGANPPWAREL